MKFLACCLVLAVFLFLGQTQAQCPNAPQYYSCSGGYHSGRSGGGCYGGTRWYYNPNTRSCGSFYYNGCGGNSNRYCSYSACQQRCYSRG
ncbi:PREDICTED: PI-actitoxin-Axm2b-like [Bactrocera latifrons]|uniref:PI-actitoxin-Axm2b-like n=1 Tax=Bactrocera dorsalis TaxID=27457 RepID=A0ABM3JT69_BACDO|nr:PREDICTED: PI-actitoxin-Axm2b-like [Bactrocera latifrons]XP_049312419.1 PI-actitoxin-Axm2b-like [Bactrocera dorsalis]